MQKNEVPREQVISVLKEWVAPILLSIIGMLLWRDITEMRADVKLLLTQQTADRVKIEQLEKDVEILQTYVFSNKPAQDTPEPEKPNLHYYYTKPEEPNAIKPQSDDKQ